MIFLLIPAICAKEVHSFFAQGRDNADGKKNFYDIVDGYVIAWPLPASLHGMKSEEPSDSEGIIRSRSVFHSGCLDFLFPLI